MSACGSVVDGGKNVMLGPVGNSPGPDVIVSVTDAVLLSGLPLESTMLTVSNVSCVPSTADKVVLLAVSFSVAAVPEVGPDRTIVSRSRRRDAAVLGDHIGDPGVLEHRYGCAVAVCGRGHN